MNRVAGTFVLERALERFPRFASRDLDEVRHQGSQVFCDHRLQLCDGSPALDAQVFYRPLRRLGLGRMSYGAAVDIDPGALQTFYLLQIPLRGHERVACDGRAFDTDRHCASLVSPWQRLQMRHETDTEKLFLRVDAGALRQLAQREWPGEPTPQLLNALDWQQPRLHSLRRLLEWLFEEASCGQLLDQPALAEQVERSVMLALLHAAADTMPAPPQERIIRPGFVRRAVECIHTRASEPLSVGDIAEAVGVSKRTLYAGFRQYVGDTPLAYLKAARLDGVRADLLGARERRESVSDIALRWGFFHLGQFAADYRRRFGERPSATLGRGQRT